MAMLSDSAKLTWPWFWCAKQPVGRVELNYRDFVRHAFRQFKKPPSEQQFWDWVAEFHEAYLLFVYQVDGRAWGQWDVSEKYLPHYKTRTDQRTPGPTVADFNEWRKQYNQIQASILDGKCRVLNVSENISDLPKRFQTFPIGEERRD